MPRNGDGPSPSKKRKRTTERTEDEARSEDDVEQSAESSLNQLKGFVTRAPGDKYLLAHQGPARSSGNLLSDQLDRAFTKQSFESAISAARLSAGARRAGKRSDERLDKLEADFDEWLWLLNEGFSLFLHGYGGKRRLLDRFVAFLRQDGDSDVVFVDGAEQDCQLSDIVTAVETLTKDATVDQAKTIVAIERRIRNLLKQDLEKKACIILHCMDKVKWVRHFETFAMLLQHPQISLCASFEHHRAVLTVPPTLATARRANKNGISGGLSAFHVHAATFDPIFDPSPADALDTLSTFLPPSIVPSLSSGINGQAILDSVVFVLASVSERAKGIFKLLVEEQATAFGQLTTAQKRKVDLRPATSARGEDHPEVAVTLSRLKDTALETLAATHEEQVSALLGEFEDHGIVNRAQQNGEDWLWLSLNEEELADLNGQLV